MGPHGKGVILQNHGILTACQSVDSVVVLFMRLEQLCETQLLVDAAGGELNLERQEAAIVFRTNGGEEEAWRQAQTLYETLDEETGGDYKL
jgi:ribulose-5-phosphate 4-epimerase/fuculose-1-phosphate aldolase